MCSEFVEGKLKPERGPWLQGRVINAAVWPGGSPTTSLSLLPQWNPGVHSPHMFRRAPGPQPSEHPHRGAARPSCLLEAPLRAGRRQAWPPLLPASFLSHFSASGPGARGALRPRHRGAFQGRHMRPPHHQCLPRSMPSLRPCGYRGINHTSYGEQSPRSQ